MRSIPACAGEPPIYWGEYSGKKVHPRVCGGAGRFLTGCQKDDGPSPRVRGSPTPYVSRDGVHRSIPACAGEP